MTGLTVDDILTSHRPTANRLGFQQMIRDLKSDVSACWENRGRLGPTDARYGAAVRHVALVQTYQQLGQYQAAARSWNQLRGRLGLDGNVPDSLRRALGAEAGDHAAAVFFHLDPVKSEFNTTACQRHLDDALVHLERPSNRAQFYWRHCVNDLVAGRRLRFDEERDRYFHLTRDEDPLVSRANMLWIESMGQSLVAGGARGLKLQHAEDALWLYLEANVFSDALLDRLDQPNLTTHTILCGARHKLLLRRRIDFLNRVDDRETEYRRCLKLIGRLMKEAGIGPDADGFRENRVASGSFIDECRPFEPTTPGVDAAWLFRCEQGDRAARLAFITDLTNSLL